MNKLTPDLDDVLAGLRNSIFANLNCIQIGKIESVNLQEQTAEIQIQIKRRKANDNIINYPLLVDCPIVVMQGGGAFLEFPIKKGDYCLVLFNDRSIDEWWSTVNVVEPRNRRKHSLSDGFALVGINPKTSVLDLSGDKVVLDATSYPLEVKGETIQLNGNSKEFVTHTELDAALQGFITKYNTDMAAILAGATAAIAASGLWSTPLANIGIASLDISSSKTTTIKTGG